MWSVLRPQFRVDRELVVEATVISDHWREQVRRSCHRLLEFREPEMATVVTVVHSWPAGEPWSPHRHPLEMASALVETALVEMAWEEAATPAICQEEIWAPVGRPPELDRSLPDPWNRWSPCLARAPLNHPRRPLPTHRV